MRLSKGLTACGFVGVVASIWLWAYGCDERAIQPWPPPEPPKDYPVYIATTRSFDRLFIYHPVTRKIDTLRKPCLGERGITASADGKLLYCANFNEVLIIDADSVEVIDQIPIGVWERVVVSPDNNYIALCGDSVHILSTEDYSPVYTDTGCYYHGVFSADSRTFYAVGETGTEGIGYLYTVRDFAEAPSASRRQFPQGPIMWVFPTPDESKLILYARYHFMVHDVAGDSLLYHYAFGPGAGYLAVTPDGRYAFFTNPSTPIEERGTTHVAVFDIEANDVIVNMETDEFLDTLGPLYFGVGPMVVTPDNRWLVGLNGAFPSQLLLFDLMTFEIVDFDDFCDSNSFSGLSVQQWK